MKTTITLKKIFHRDRFRYAIFYSYNEKVTALVKAIPGATYSATWKCFYFSAEESYLKMIISSLKDIANVDISGISHSSEIKANHDERKAYDTEVKQVRNTSEVPVHVVANTRHAGNQVEVVFSIRESDGMLIIKLPRKYDKEWIREMKSFGKANYDSNRNEWQLKWSRLKVDSLSDYFTSLGVPVSVENKGPLPVIKELRNDAGAEVRSKELNEKSINGIEEVRRYLCEKRYSSRTVSSYVSHLEMFFKFYREKDPEEISTNDVSHFFHDFVLPNKYSTSYQNQMTSALKIYYNLNESRSLLPADLERPRRGRALPKVFSKEEIIKIFNATRNSKHQLILWMVYSCGLRRSEVINIRIADLDFSRGTLSICEGKGNIDRMVPVPPKVWEKIKAYIKSYEPEEYLFEGQTGGKYSVESVYNIFKKSMARAGINKDVGIHSLRHSYATHLHENGLDIRYIQELLGHKSTRTTEIYTHVSRRNLLQVRSPIEDMEI